MYWPVAPSRVLRQDADILSLARNRKGTLFASLSKVEIVIWNVRPTARLASVERSEGSVSKYGENVSVSWSHDGRNLLLLTSHGYIINYAVLSTGTTVLHYPPTPEFPPGAGEGQDIGGLTLENAGVSRLNNKCTSISSHTRHILLSTSNPPTILRVPWPIPAELITTNDHTVPPLDGDDEYQVDVEKWILKDLPWLEGLADDVMITHFDSPRTLGQYTLVLSDGRGFIVHFRQSRETPSRNDDPFISPMTSRAASTIVAGRQVYPIGTDEVVTISVNPKFGLAVVGTKLGTIHAISLPIYPQPLRPSHKYDLTITLGRHADTGSIMDLSWTSDGYGLAVGYERGWGVWSIGGRLCGYGLQGDDLPHDSYMNGVSNLFWLPGNLELVMLAKEGEKDRMHILPFTKSSNTSQQTPDSARYAMLQLDDKLLVYRGADQPDMSVINPESDVWQPVKYPMMYISTNWPIRYATISADGKLIAIAGRYGLTHFSTISGRWKLFRDEVEENEMTVRGGLLWYHHVLVAAVETDSGNEIRMYSRDLDLANRNVLHTETLPAPVLLMSLLENSLLVYTADNTLYHFLIETTKDSIRLNVCGSISFRGIVAMPNRVRGMSWMIPPAQKALGDPVHDLMVATIIFLVDSRLVLLRPRRAGNNEVRYDMQVLADHIEAYWTHLSGIGTLENSLWGYDGSSIRVWMDALTVEATSVNSETDSYVTVRESVKLDLDFYPLSILMDKGIIIGVDHEVSGRRGLPFTLFKIQSGAHLFLPAVLRYHLEHQHTDSAVLLASCYDQLVYFAYALEVLLYRVLDDEDGSLLRSTIEFLDFFPQSLDIVVACARKTETTKWSDLFAVAGEPRDLYAKCIKRGLLRTASSYLLVMHTMHPEGSGSEDTVRLLQLAIKRQDVQLAKDLLRFLQGIDATNRAFTLAIKDIGL